MNIIIVLILCLFYYGKTFAQQRTVSALDDICKRFPDLSSCPQNKPQPTVVPPISGLATPPNIPTQNDYCTNYRENFGAYCGGSVTDPSIISFCNTYGVRCRGWSVAQPTPAPPVQVTPVNPFFTPQPPVQPVRPVQPVQPVQPGFNPWPSQPGQLVPQNQGGILGSQIGSGQALGGRGGLPNWLQSSSPLQGLGGQSQIPTFGGPVNGGLGLGTGWQVPFVGASQGLNVVPTQGLVLGRGLNVAGLGFGQTGGINYGGLPGLSSLNNAWGLGPSAINGLAPQTTLGKRRRRSALLQALRVM